MKYHFSVGDPITEEEALAKVAKLGMHGLAFDINRDDDEPLHWHEFDVVAWVISGTGSFADEHGNVTRTQPGCHLHQPAGYLHRDLAGTNQRVVIGTSIPGEQFTHPIDKDPAERPEALAI